MRINATIRSLAAASCLLSLGCDTRTADKNVPPREELRGAAGATPFRIIATEAGFDAPDSVAAGLRHIVFENRGSEIHEAMLVKLPKGMSAKDYVGAVKNGSLFPEGALDYSGPGLTSPGETVEVWLSVDPGQYVLVCWNSGHATSTPVHSFTVQDNRADDGTPKEDLVLKLVDFRFELEGNLHKGVQVIRVETLGPSMHQVDVFRLHEGRTVADPNRWRKEDAHGPAPADALGGALDSHDLSRVVWLRRTFSPGRYVLHCEMPMTTDVSASGMELTHADVGMVREFEIKE